MLRGNQDARICMALCRRAGQPTWWTEDGPSRQALDALHGKHTLSSGQEALVRLAFDVFNGAGNVLVSRLLGVLDTYNLHAVGTLLVALADGADAVEAWLAAQSADGGRA